jgi:Flp pilus assembly protein TadG
VSRPAGRRHDEGNAVVEFVLVAVLVLVPLLYVVLAASQVQRTSFAVTQAAREAGRAVATADDVATGEARARYAVALAIADHGLGDDARGIPGGAAELRFVAVGDGCDGPAVSPSLEPGARFAVCVTAHITLPGVPDALNASHNTVTGRFVVRVEDFRSAS